MGKAAKICLFRGLEEPPAHPGVDVWSPTGWRGKKIRIIPRQAGWKLGKGAAPLLEGCLELGVIQRTGGIWGLRGGRSIPGGIPGAGKPPVLWEQVLAGWA